MSIDSLNSTEYFFAADLSGFSLTWAFRFPETQNYLRKWITGSSEKKEDMVCVSNQEFSDWKSLGNDIDAFAEFCLLCQQTSETLLRHDRCVIHAGAVRIRDRAFLIAAGSGVGKSTQIRTLTELYPEEVTVINGDKPILEDKGDCIMVHPSPWNGKEGWHGAESAPLGGVILLRRGEENQMEALSSGKAASLLYLQIFQSFTDEKMIHLAGSMTEKILKNAPAWLLTNKGVPDSTRLMYETILKEVGSHGI